MSSSATFGAGVTLGYDTGPVVLLAEVLDIEPPEQQVAKVDISNHDSASKKREYIAGWTTQSDPTFTLIYLKAAATTLRGFIDNKTVKDWTLTYPDGSKEEFTGFLTSHGIASPLEDKMTQRCGICITDSDSDFTAGS